MTALAPTPARGLRQAHWGLADQAVSAVTNVGVTVLVARTSSAERLGEFSLVYLIFVLVLALVRTTGAGVLAIHHANDPTGQGAAARACARYALGVGVWVGGGLLAVGLVVGGELGATAVLLGLAMPLLLLQENRRGLFFLQGLPLRALVTDLWWAGGQLLATVLLLTTVADPSLPLVAGTWVAGGVVASLVGCVQVGYLPPPQSPTVWLRRYREVAAPVGLSELLSQAPIQAVYLMLPLVASLTDLGAVRAAYVFFGPLAVLNAGIAALALPDAVRAGSAAATKLLAAKVSVVLAVISTAWGLVIIWLPDTLGRAVVGSSWDLTGPARTLLALSLVAEGILIGPVAGLSALRLTGLLVATRAVAAPVVVITGLGLASLVGAAGAAAGFAIGYGLGALAAWLFLARARPPSPSRPPLHPPAAPPAVPVVTSSSGGPVS